MQEIYANTPPPLATFAYDLDGRRTSRALANGVTTVYDYDMAGQLTNLAHTTVSGTVASFRYDYNAVGSRTSALREDSRNEVYDYDAIQQVTSVDYGDSTSEGFNYDPLGNLNTRTNVSGSVDTFTANNLNQYTAINATAPGYDSKGNLLTWSGGTNAYDAQNRLLTVQRDTNSATFVYDGRNRCMQRTINGVTTTCIYDGWDLIAEYNGSTPLAEYVHGPGVDEVLARFTATNAVYYAGDALNSTAALTDGSGNVVERYRHMAFGQPTVFDASGNALTTSAYGNRFTFQGREWFSELNLTDHRNRYYAPELQRWVNRDPIGERGGLNLYAYIRNNPINFLDTLGLRIVMVPGFQIGFPSQVGNALNKLNQNPDMAQAVHQIENSDNDLLLIDQPNSDFFDPGNNSVHWDPNHSLKKNDNCLPAENNMLDPAGILGHELGHASHWDRDQNGYIRDVLTQTGDDYDNLEEMQQIQGLENSYARQNGQIIRENHRGVLY